VLDAYITDFDGVMVDSEPLHFRGFAEILAPEGVTLSREAYFTVYLGLDDHDCFQAIATDQGKALAEDRLAEMIEAKSTLMQDLMAREIQALPGTPALLAAASQADVPLAICSGGLRAEVELSSRAVGIWDYFLTAVTARDVACGKPDPEGYLKALGELQEITGRDLLASRCVVTEDSPAGVAAGKAAGMNVIAVTNSYPASALGQADRIVDTLDGVTPETLSEWFSL
jgi:beta-phosphoglucomutase